MTEEIKGIDISDVTSSEAPQAPADEEFQYVKDNPDELMDYLDQADPALAMIVKQFTEITNQINMLHQLVDANTQHLSYLLAKDPEFMLKFNAAKERHERAEETKG